MHGHNVLQLKRWSKGTDKSIAHKSFVTPSFYNIYHSKSNAMIWHCKQRIFIMRKKFIKAKSPLENVLLHSGKISHAFNSKPSGNCECKNQQNICNYRTIYMLVFKDAKDTQTNKQIKSDKCTEYTGRSKILHYSEIKYQF